MKVQIDTGWTSLNMSNWFLNDPPTNHSIGIRNKAATTTAIERMKTAVRRDAFIAETTLSIRPIGPEQPDLGDAYGRDYGQQDDRHRRCITWVQEGERFLEYVVHDEGGAAIWASAREDVVGRECLECGHRRHNRDYYGGPAY